MTTIAWDGRMLAADRCRVSTTGMKQSVVKVIDAGEYVFAVCGDLVDKPTVARWLIAGAKWEERPELDRDVCAGIAVRKKDAAVFLVEGKRPTLNELPPGPTAVGSGSPYAVAAMACGKNAREAVEIATMFDESTGLGVNFVEFGEASKPMPMPDDPKERPTVPRIEAVAPIPPPLCQCGRRAEFANGSCRTCAAIALG